MVISMANHGSVDFFIKRGSIFIEAGTEKIAKASIHMKRLQDILNEIVGKGRLAAISPDNVG